MRFKDLHKLKEDERIKMIYDAVMKMGMKGAFVVETNEKADRYMAKLKELAPTIVEVRRGRMGPNVAVIVGPPKDLPMN